MNYIKVFITFSSLALGLLMFTSTVSAEQGIDTSWKKYKVSISFIDTEGRLFVASDREFFVPFNTAIYNRNNQPVALSTLKVGNKIWLYLGDKNSARPEIKRIEIIK